MNNKLGNCISRAIVIWRKVFGQLLMFEEHSETTTSTTSMEPSATSLLYVNGSILHSQQIFNANRALLEWGNGSLLPGGKVRKTWHLLIGYVLMSHNQSPVLKWSTQNHVKNQEGGRSYLWLGLSPTNLHQPSSTQVVIVALVKNQE